MFNQIAMQFSLSKVIHTRAKSSNFTYALVKSELSNKEEALEAIVDNSMKRCRSCREDKAHAKYHYARIKQRNRLPCILYILLEDKVELEEEEKKTTKYSTGFKEKATHLKLFSLKEQQLRDRICSNCIWHQLPG